MDVRKTLIENGSRLTKGLFDTYSLLQKLKQEQLVCLPSTQIITELAINKCSNLGTYQVYVYELSIINNHHLI